MNSVLIGLVFLTVASATPAFGQMKAPACDGDISIVRISEIKPGSSLDAYMNAQKAHIAWYRTNGFTDNEISSARILVQDPATQGMKYSENQVMSIHARPPAAALEGSLSAKDKAGWDAYVKQYRDASDIKTEYIVCMPKKP